MDIWSLVTGHWTLVSNYEEARWAMATFETINRETSIILYGGSFNPPHVSHVLFAVYLRALFPRARLVVVPVYGHAFGKALLDYDFRLELLGMAFGGIEGVEISDIERELGRVPGYTVDVVEAFRRREAGKQIYVAIGADILDDLPRWHRYEDLCSQAEFIVFPREGYDGLGRALPLVVLPGVSSRWVRQRMRLGEKDEALRACLPALVMACLEDRGGGRLFGEGD